MTKVLQCDVEECAYNSDHLGQQGDSLPRQCHTMAITIGGTFDHMCDTFCRSSLKGGSADTISTVGACKVANCAHNRKLECGAPGIKVGHIGEEVDCLTFAMK